MDLSALSAGAGLLPLIVAAIGAVRQVSVMRRAVCLTAVALGLLVAGCLPDSRDSIVDTPLPVDAKLAGMWVPEARGENPSFSLRLHAPTATSIDAEFTIHENCAPDRDDRRPRLPIVQIERFRAARTLIGTHNIAEFVRSEPTARLTCLPDRFFVAFTTDGPDRLLVYPPRPTTPISTSPLTRAIQDGRLAGTAARTDKGRDMITATTGELRAFVANTADVFDQSPLTLVRSDGSARK